MARMLAGIWLSFLDINIDVNEQFEPLNKCSVFENQIILKGIG